MSEKFVTVATFHRSFEAQLAKNLLEEEGIASNLSGEITADMLPFGQAGGSDQIVLQVRDDDAQRASGILAVVAAAKLEDNWEEEAESGAGVWICSICGEPISNRLSMCYSCQTPREGIRASAPRDPTAIQPDLSTLPTGEEVQKRDEIVRTPAPIIAPAQAPAPRENEAEREEEPLAAAGDDLARRALLASMSGILLPFSWYYLTKLFFFSGELSPKGMRYLYGALFLNLLIVLVIVLWSGRVIWL
jgi:hypothetical protein